MMANAVYVVCALTSGLCAYLMTRGYLRSRERLLLWGSLCFICLAIANLFLVIDFALLPDVDLAMLRLIPTLLGVALMLFGLVWESSR